ncbi:hypothetical protein [Pedobacter sp. N23S346]|uniref:hypothetical protein n=1 Tax=Pedobacter sp. N23S346 TaxID=3402750 RepID=UPI003AC4E880
MDNLTASIKLRLPVSLGKALLIGFLIFGGYLICVILSFVFQSSIDSLIGVNPAKMSIITLLIIIFIPWGLLGWLLIIKFTDYGYLNLYEDHLTISSIENKLIKNYQAMEIAFIKIQDAAFHITFKDGYRFNCVNLGMEKGYIEKLSKFSIELKTFIEKNSIPVSEGRII